MEKYDLKGEKRNRMQVVLLFIFIKRRGDVWLGGYVHLFWVGDSFDF